jgi:hypothetical protein
MKCSLRDNVVAFAIFASALTISSASALADRGATADEKVALATAVAAAGCSGGEIEVEDDGKFEVEKVICGDGKLYELLFDSSFALIEKKPGY